MSHEPAKPIGPRAGDGRIQPMVVLLAAAAAGIVVDRFYPHAVAGWLAASGGCLVGWAGLWRARFTRTAALLLLGAAAALGGAWHHTYWNLYPADALGRAAAETPRPICVELLVLKAPRRVPAPSPDAMRTVPVGDRSRLTVRAVGVRDGAAWRPASGDAELLVDGHVLGVHAGDRLRAFAMCAEPASPSNPGQRDYARHRRAERQLFRLWTRYPDGVSVVSRGPVFSGRRMLGWIRQRSDRLLHRYLYRRQAELAAAVLLGAREQLTRDRTEEFFTTGTVHLLAISGLHVGILAFGFWWVTRLFAVRRRTALFAAAAFVVAYALLTDARPPVVRASVLTVAFCAARLCGRRGSTFNTLAAAALVLLAWNPTNLFGAGPQLSFLAVATIGLFGPWIILPRSEDPLDRLIARTRPWYVRGWRRFMQTGGVVCAITTLVWLFALPLIMYRFHLVAPVALLLNPFLWIPVAVALFAGFGVLLFGWLIPPVGHACGWLCNASLAAVERIVSGAGDLPGGHFWVAGPPAWWVLAFYGGVAALAASGRYRPRRRWWAVFLAVWLALGAAWAWNAPRRMRAAGCDRLVCTFVAVGHGASAVIELPEGQILMCDAGRVGSPKLGVEAISAVLWSRRISRIDALVLTHADADHYNAVPELLDRFSVGAVYVSPSMFQHDDPALTALREAIQRAHIPVRRAWAGRPLDLEGATGIDVLHPPGQGVPGSDNANSIVLCVACQGKRLLLLGDLESPGLDRLLEREPLDCDVVLAPHHGSPRSNPAGLAGWSTPEWVVVSGGPDDWDPDVARAYRRQGAEVLCTSHQGAVRVAIQNGRVAVDAWRTRPWKD